MNTINLSNEDIDKILKVEAKNRKAIDKSLSVSQNMVNILKSEFEEIDSELAGNIAKELMDGVVSLVNQMNLRNLAVIIIAGYVGFQVIYLMITGVLYAIRYREGHRSLHNYEVHLKRARRMLRRKGKR